MNLPDPAPIITTGDGVVGIVTEKVSLGQVLTPDAAHLTGYLHR